MPKALSIAALLATAAATPAAAQRWVPEAGTHAYRYESVQHIPSQPDRGARIDYDLVADGKGGAVAVVRAVWKSEGGTYTPIAVDDPCRTALHAGAGELARVTLYPISKQTAETLGADFMALCAPRELYFSMTDLLNLALIQASPQFGLASLAKPGDSQRFEPFRIVQDRLGITTDSQAAGGTTRFAALDGGIAAIDWAPDSMTISFTDRTAIPGRELLIEGTGHFGFRVEIDRATGTMLRAHTTTNRFDVVVNVPDAPPIPMTFTSEVTVGPRP
ncbi:hypothetical protein [Sphingomonas sp.]|uniref:hypothetical protein n=1 Tax=Sphingomonas sp. TaxID=28214 RepID=UPI001B0049A2|nr:hypothetical protein [Sphingomonas sp.]MBO9712987.1 hypothetical protein [Sphingomonas sp.]